MTNKKLKMSTARVRLGYFFLRMNIGIETKIDAANKPTKKKIAPKTKLELASVKNTS